MSANRKVNIALVYPYFFEESKDASIFKYPPLGLGYLAASLQHAGVSVEIIDGTYSSRRKVLDRIKDIKPEILGFYCMMTMEEAALSLGRQAREYCGLLVAGGPYPSADPEKFLSVFDAVVMGEGEQTICELAASLRRDGGGLNDIAGLAFWEKGRVRRTRARSRVEELDDLPMPARDLFDNKGYMTYWRDTYGYTVASMMTTRGCPHTCGFCSKPVFSSKVTARSAAGVVDEMEDIAARGYDRIWVGDDCFTYDRARTKQVCELIIERGLRIDWECLSRADGISKEMLEMMREAGCLRLFFGLESGSDEMLKLMKKRITFDEGRRAIDLAGKSGLKTGAFFILGYPGETNETLTRTVNESSRLNLDYLSYTVPYPLPGTDLYDKVKDRLKAGAWTNPRSHTLLYKGDFSIFKLKFAMGKGLIQHRMRSLALLGAIEPPFRHLSDAALRVLR